MSKFLVRGSYTNDGLKGVLKEGGSSRVEAVRQLVEGLGGTLESFYFAFGDDDFFITIDGMSNISTLAGTLIVNAAGGAKVKTTVLLTAEELDEVTRITAKYRSPGR